ncbi:MAG TPA: hypothetical protein DCM23_02660 [Firmicutes bacterium]|nr:hypothetical protein [Bacillota bacterium]
MKLLRKMKIINWHYFWNETITFEPIVFLTGPNAAGKSTLIDAMQIILLGDTTGRYFNKAASDKSTRTLKGYLKGELGDAEEGGFNYLRTGRFTSYLAMEFFDDKSEKSFTFGCVFDCFDDGSEEHRFFLLEDKIPSNEFIENKVPLEYKALSKFFKDNYPNGHRFFDSNRQYTDTLKRRFGGLKDKYFSLIKKAVSFTPITDIETFITEYVCDPQANVNIEPMQENIIQYKKLETEAQTMQVRIDRLEEIERTYQAYAGHKENFDLFSYLIENSELHIEQDTLESYIAQLRQAKERLTGIDIDLADVASNISELDKKKFRLIADRVNSDAYKLTDELQETKKTTTHKLKTLQDEIDAIINNLKRYADNYASIGQLLVESLTQLDFDLLDNERADDLRRLLDLSEQVASSSTKLQHISLANVIDINIEELNTWREILTKFKMTISATSVNLARTMLALDQATSTLRQEEANMRQGGKPYEFALLAIKRELTSRLSEIAKKDVEVSILADLIDIRHPLWANAIEGYLHSQKFNLIVPEQYYLEAYDIFKALLEKNRYYGTQLVDIGAIIDRKYVAEVNSLAEEIITDHEGARAYINFLIGRLKKCKTPQEARNSGNGITPETDLYRSFTMGRIHPNTYKIHFIGRRISEEQMAHKQQEIVKNMHLASELKQLNESVSKANNLEVMNTFEMTNSLSTLSRTREIRGLEQTLKYVEGELSKHDLSQIASYDQRIADIDEDIAGLRADQASLNEEKGRLISSIDMLTKDKIPGAKVKVNERVQRLETAYDPFLVAEKGMPLFDRLRLEGKSYLDIVSEYHTNLSNVQYLVGNLFSQLVRLRREYVRDYRLTLDTESSENLLYDTELVEMRDVKLPQYKEKIADAYAKATKQFKDDFISKLRGAIDSVIDQIEDLNEALKAAMFGNDSYQFTVKPSAQYRRYYDMIKDDMLLGLGEDDSPFVNKYADVMNDLFKQIVDIGRGDANSAILENVAKFTDYRSYLDFDLLVTNQQGVSQHLSKVIKKKSGGETQTPFYISVLASFAQLYRIQDTGELANSIRLIIFDEAFSKMDRGRIQEAVRLLRSFGFQAILSAPSDKVADISSLVDQTLVVLNKNNASRVHLYAEVAKMNKSIS